MEQVIRRCNKALVTASHKEIPVEVQFWQGQQATLFLSNDGTRLEDVYGKKQIPVGRASWAHGRTRWM